MSQRIAQRLSVVRYVALVVSVVLVTMGVVEAAVAAPQAAEGRVQAFSPEEQLGMMKEPLYRPLIERYILDELKSVRQDQQQFRADIAKQFADTRLEVSDRAISYTADTVNNIFIIITAAASLLVLVGWSSLREMKLKMEEVVNIRVDKISEEYESRLHLIEEKIKARSDEIIHAQEEIAKTNEVHALWMRVGLENNPQTKIELYDKILELNPYDVEAYAYKADSVLELSENEWAINLCNKAISVDPDYAYAYWQRACANAESGYIKDAISDVSLALEKNPQLAQDIGTERSFDALKEVPEFQDLCAKYDQ